MPKICWFMGAGVKLIRDLQAKAFGVDFYLCLAGGVLNRGYSYNDLDIVAVGNSPHSKAEELQKVLEEMLQSPVTRVKLVNGRVHLKWTELGIEVLVIEKDSR